MKNKEIDNKKRVFVMAEMAASYEGDPKIAEFIIEKSAEAKADGIEFQMRDLDTYIIPSDVDYQQTKDLCLSQDDWGRLIEKAFSLGLDVWANVYDLASAKFSKDKKIKGFKFHSSVLENEDLIKEVIQTKKPLLLSIGGIEEEEIKKTLDFIYSIDKKVEIYLMYGLQNFPTKPEGVNLNFIKELSEKFNLPWGYQDHSEPTSPASNYMSILAIGRGASIIEKHITHNRALKGVDYEAALNPDEFADFVKDIRIVNNIINKKPEEVSSDELQYKEYKTLMKVVATAEIKPGDNFSKDNIAVVRAKKGEIKGKNLKFLLNKKAKQNYQKFEPIKRNEFFKIGIFITARLKSKRLSLKAIKPILGKPMIDWMIERLRHCNIEPIVMMTSTNPQDDPLVEIAKKQGIDYFRGSEEDVLLRIRDCARKFDVDLIVSTPADNPLVEPIFIEKMIERNFEKNFDFCEVEGLPIGCGTYGGAYVISREAVEKVCQIKKDSDTEIWGRFFKESGKFKCEVLKVQDPNIYRPQYRLTVDEEKDFELVSESLNRNKMKIYVLDKGVYGSIVVTAKTREEAVKIIKAEDEFIKEER
ncbi:MAG: N-acetylneuraminate synthase family protein, partial [Candidatus Nealsonbacteria bacterium]|nr:N-acetylneuraminate synthase family protein [Candidatus Nealsonbacteria bacterium]